MQSFILDVILSSTSISILQCFLSYLFLGDKFHVSQYFHKFKNLKIINSEKYQIYDKMKLMYKEKRYRDIVSR